LGELVYLVMLALFASSLLKKPDPLLREPFDVRPNDCTAVSFRLGNKAFAHA
jgi:hypothetical protein